MVIILHIFQPSESPGSTGDWPVTFFWRTRHLGLPCPRQQGRKSSPRSQNVTWKFGSKHATGNHHTKTTTLFCKNGSTCQLEKSSTPRLKQLKLNRSLKPPRRKILVLKSLRKKWEKENISSNKNQLKTRPQFGRGLHPCTKPLGNDLATWKTLGICNPLPYFPLIFFWQFTKAKWKVRKGWESRYNRNTSKSSCCCIGKYPRNGQTTNHEFHHLTHGQLQ